MLFVDDTVLICEKKKQLNEKLQVWRKELEMNGLKNSRAKMELMECYCSSLESIEEEPIRIGNDLV